PHGQALRHRPLGLALRADQPPGDRGRRLRPGAPGPGFPPQAARHLREATMKFRAAVLNKVNEPMTLDTLEMAPLGPTDVLVKVRARGLCHTDVEVIRGSLPSPLPIVRGHEGAGVVEAVGDAVTQVKPGAHVICSWNPHCGHCFYCERDLPVLCEPFTR